MTPFLSVCVPTYNNIARLQDLIYSFLSLPREDIQLVVLDNSSTDGTSTLLNSISDYRFVYKINDVNMGALYNMVNVFEYASGTYVIYSTDADFLNVSKVSDFISYLKSHTEIKCGFCNFNFSNFGVHKIFNKGYAAISAVAYKGRHPTGYFFQNKALQETRLKERFSNFEVVHLFPLEFAFAEIALSGNALIYDNILFTPNNSSDVVKIKSRTTNGLTKLAFFTPTSRLKVAVSYIKHIYILDLEVHYKSKLAAQVLLNGLFSSTFGYKTILANNRLCIHYQMNKRHIGIFEILLIAFKFFCGIVRELSGLKFKFRFMILIYIFVLFMFKSSRFLSTNLLCKL